MNYIAILEKEPETLVGGWFPDCPGAIAAGETLDEATASAVEALRLWATEALHRGETLPSARPLDEIVADPEIAAMLAKGAIAVAIPLIVDRGRQTRVNISLDVGALEAIDEAARRKGMTRSAFMTDAAIGEVASLV